MGLLFLFSGIFSIPLILIPLYKAVRRNLAFWQSVPNIPQVSQSLLSTSHVLDAPFPGDISVKLPKLTIPSWEFPELWFMGVAPLLGMWLVPTFYNEIQPFQLEHRYTLFVFILIPYACYWLSRYNKTSLPGWFNILLSHGMLIGLLLYFALFLHFFVVVVPFAASIFPFLAFPLFAPLPAFLYNLRELKLQQLELAAQAQNTNPWWAFLQLSWQNSIYHLFLTAILIAVIIYSLTLWGENPFAIVLSFLNSREFFFSMQ